MNALFYMLKSLLTVILYNYELIIKIDRVSNMQRT